jgi:hypothetical protein
MEVSHRARQGQSGSPMARSGLGHCTRCCRQVANEKKCDVVRLFDAAGKIIHGRENRFLKTIQSRLMLTVENVSEARNSKQVFVGVHCFGNAIAK